MKFGIQLALNKDGNHVSARSCSKDDGPFSCVICSQVLTLRKGSKSPPHYIHKKKSHCVGNEDQHRALSEKNEAEKSCIEPVDTTKNDQDGSMIEPDREGTPGSIDEYTEEKKQEEAMLRDALAEVLDNMDTVDSSTEPDVPDLVDEVQEVDTSTTEPEDVCNSIIDEALEFVINDVLKETKCSDCKTMGTGYHRMFTEEDREKFGLNDLYVCPSCVVHCSVCDHPNSKKRSKRANGLCFTCDFQNNQFVEESKDAIEKMGTLPESPDWLVDERKGFFLQLLARKMKGRTIYMFMYSNKHRISEYKAAVGSQLQTRKIKKELGKARRDFAKSRERNLKHRERAMGTDAVDNFKRMFNNKKMTCVCGNQNKRRHMVRYDSVMGSIKYSCQRCSTDCPECSGPSVEHDLSLFGGSCFECFAFSIQSVDTWKQGEKAVIEGCKKGNVGHMGSLYMNGPIVKKGKFSGDRLVHVPGVELDSVVRRDHPGFKELAEVIKVCRKM